MEQVPAEMALIQEEEQEDASRATNQQEEALEEDAALKAAIKINKTAAQAPEIEVIDNSHNLTFCSRI
jgi:hypothetical protein